jgi:translation initiation factor IF-2
MIVGFSVSASRSVETLAIQHEVPLCLSNIIYRLMDDIKGRVIALLPVTIETRVTGEATVLQLFDIHLKAKEIKKVAGCRVVNGIVDKNRLVKVIRNGAKIHDEGRSFKFDHLLADHLSRNLGHNATFEEGSRRSAQGIGVWNHYYKLC